MEPKSGFRTIKKSASSGAIGERKKAKQKKKKDKKKLSLKGTESTDVPSPELDSEVPLDGDVALTDQDGQSTPVVGQVTRLPRLNSHSTLSLTTSSPPPRLVTSSTTLAPTSSSSSSRTASLGHSGGTNSAPIIRSSLASGGGAGSAGAVPASPSSALVTVPSSGNLEGVVARVADLNIKQRSSTSTTTTTSSTTSSTKTRSSKGQSSKSGSGGGKSSRTRGGGNGGGSKTSQSSKNQGGGDGNNNSNSSSSSSSATVNNESLRWERVLEDTEKERERLAVYKMNRRKRYLAAAQAKGLGWALNYNSSQLGSSTSSIAVATPLSEDSGVETATCGSPGGSKTATGMTGVKNSGASPSSVSSAAGAYIDFSSMQTLRPIPAHRGLQEAFVEC